MPLYLLPPSSTFDPILEVLNRSKIELLQPKKLYEVILQSPNHHTLVAALDTAMLQVLGRHATQLVEEVPTVILQAPDVYYEPSWLAHASEMPFITWTEFEKKLSKSGHTAYTPEQMEKNSRSANESGSNFRSPDSEEDDDVDLSV